MHIKYLFLVSLLLTSACTRVAAPQISPSPLPSAKTEIPMPSIATSSPQASPNPLQTPILTYPKPNTKVTSPLTVTGTLPPGWMFEGVAMVKIADSQGNNITTAQAKEKIPGTWQSGKPVEFQATLTFQTKALSGFILLEADNPSGLPENAKSFLVPITF